MAARRIRMHSMYVINFMTKSVREGEDVYARIGQAPPP